MTFSKWVKSSNNTTNINSRGSPMIFFGLKKHSTQHKRYHWCTGNRVFSETIRQIDNFTSTLLYIWNAEMYELEQQFNIGIPMFSPEQWCCFETVSRVYCVTTNTSIVDVKNPLRGTACSGCRQATCTCARPKHEEHFISIREATGYRSAVYALYLNRETSEWKWNWWCFLKTSFNDKI